MKKKITPGSPKKSLAKRLLYWLYVLLLIFPCLELLLWIVGGRPYYEETYAIEITPKGAFQGDENLGIRNAEGEYTILLNHGLSFNIAHNEKGERVTTFEPEDKDSLPKIVFFGCSYTYGYGVNNDETFVAQLQASFPQYHFLNKGVIGYGTVQSYLQLKKMLENGINPAAVFLNFSSYHFDRNALTPQYRRALGIGFNQSLSEANESMTNAKFPYCASPEKLDIQFIPWDSLYADWQGRGTFASINYLQTQWEVFQRHRLKVVLVTRLLIEAMHELCNQHGIPFHLVLLDENEETDLLRAALNPQIAMVPMHFDFSNKEMINAPYDTHPNKIGHAFIADKLYSILANLELKR